MIDFSKVSNFKQKKEINPRDLFMGLPSKDPQYAYLRDVQAEVLKQWFDNRNLRNNIIKMNTGSGKTVVALMILQSSLNENTGNAVYVVPDQYLVNQVINEAEKLGIKTSISETDPDFLSKKSILIINVHKLVNGKSVFGMRRGSNIPIDTLLFDDVHSCIETINQQFTLSIKQNTAAFDDIMKLLEGSLKSYSEDVHYNLFTNPKQYYDIVLPFWIWQDKYIEIKRILENLEQSEDKDEIDFKLPLISDELSLCNCVISTSNIEIAPKFISIQKIQSYEKAKRRIFMSATLSDDTVFLNTLGIEKDSIDSIITPEKANDIGERLMIFPEYLNPALERVQIKSKLFNLSKNYNVVVIVPTYERAKGWSDVASTILSVAQKNLEAGIDNLKKGHVGLTIIINKYDGIDLPYDACRILVIDDLPNVSSMYDRVIQNINSNDKKILRKQVQKIEQGIGRGVRSNTDYCVIVFMGKKLINSLIIRNGIDYFSIATAEQFKLSQNIWDLIPKEKEKPNIDEIFEVSKYSLDRNVEWIQLSKDTLNNVKYVRKLNYDEHFIKLLEALIEFNNQNQNTAFSLLELYKNSLKDSELIGQVYQLMAEFTNFTNKSKAQELQKVAYKNNKFVTKPIDGIEFVKNININLQAINIINYLKKNNIQNTNEYLLHIKEIFEDLIFQVGNHKKFEESINNLFNCIGFIATRPDSELGVGPDNLVALGNGKYLVIECKNEAIAEKISKDYTNQLNGSIKWFEINYGKEGFECTPIMIHKSTEFSFDSSPDINVRIINEEMLLKITNKINEFVVNLQHTYNPLSEVSLSKILRDNRLLYSDIVNNYTHPYKKVIK